jgi:hypothetical protein
VTGLGTTVTEVDRRWLSHPFAFALFPIFLERGAVHF